MKRESFAFRLLLLPISAIALCLADHPVRAAGDEIVFAAVNDFEISRDEFEREVYTAASQTFYHGRPPGPEEFIEFRKDIADQMIERYLLLQEARRRELQPDTQSIDAKIAVYEDRYGDTERWQTEGPTMVVKLRARFEEDSVLASLEADVRAVAKPDQETLRAFYDDNQELFTEPARNRVSLILLGVAPSAEAPAWQAAREEAERISGRLANGASFTELASLHSSDVSAGAGGDMGYLHDGMLSTSAEEAIAALEIGEVSQPVQVLEGIALFRLTEREPEKQRTFEEVRGRAEDLWFRAEGEQMWRDLIAGLRSSSQIQVDTDYLVTLPSYAQ